jgi:predicted metal-dependent hydrolase
MYQEGIELFDAGFYWEAHEAWEGVWHHLGRTSPRALWVKALIKIAAAGVKMRQGTARGVDSHLDGAIRILQALENSDEVPPVQGLLELVHATNRKGGAPHDDGRSGGRVVFSTSLRSCLPALGKEFFSA